MRTGAYTRDFDLPGWSEQSIWGYDELLESFWAQLWRDEDRFDAPRISISSYHLIPTIPALARVIADQLGINEGEACLALLGRSRLDRVRTAIQGRR
ncbi:hypothetical protein [Pengzhenrongella sp.]|jgi:hypothetical protein|uniref:hypothetical protein n=1 Tax=Pengzhenrongella sp. TaxID=2888820 RepID=UPI002F92FF2A